MQLLELDGSSVTERRMLTLLVIKHFDVLEDLLLGLLPGLETAVMDQLRLTVWKKLSAGAWSQQLPLRLMLQR